MDCNNLEERNDLLLPSRSNDDLSFPSPATWSEVGHSSSSATLVEPPPISSTDTTRRNTRSYSGLLFGAALTSVLHHVYLFVLRGRTVSDQFWIKNSSNALSTLVQWLCMGSVSVSLTQLVSILYSNTGILQFTDSVDLVVATSSTVHYPSTQLFIWFT